MRIHVLLVATLIVSFSQATADAQTTADDYDRFSVQPYQMPPLRHELLPQPVSFKYCPGLVITEWRPTPDSEDLSGPNDKSKRIIHSVCKNVYENFSGFIEARGLRAKKHWTLQFKFSLIPADVSNYGTDYRSLNDLNFRFKFRQLKQIPFTWGYCEKAQGYCWVRNDVLKEADVPNHRFKTVFAHELFHAISMSSGLFDTHPGPRYLADEKLAIEFTQHLGYGT